MRWWSIITANDAMKISVECSWVDGLESLVGGPEEEKEK
jgi:hypothetical protein